MNKRKHLKMLLVDEHDEFRHLIEEIADLAGQAYDITFRFTSSEREAKQLLKGWEPSVILVDAHISDGNSYDLVKACRGGRAAVVVTSDEQDDDVERAARRWGASGYLPKCHSIEEVERLLKELVDVTVPDDGVH